MFRTKSSRARVVLAATCAGIMVGATACGSDSSADGAIEVVMAQSVNTSLANLTIDADLGEAEGLTLERVAAASGGSSNQMAALISGDVDFAVSGTNTAIDAIAQGAQIEIIGGLGPLTNSLTMATSVADELSVSADDPIEERIESLRGLTVAAPTPGSAGYAVLQVLLDSVGLTESDLTLVPISDNAAIPAGLLQGTYDASFSSLGPGEVAVASGDAVTLASVPLGDFPQLDGYIGVCLYTSKRMIEEDPELVEQVRSAFLAAQEMAVDDPDAAAEALQSDTLEALDGAVFDEVWTQVVEGAPGDIAFDEENWDVYVELFGDEIDYSELTYEDVVAEVARG